MASTSCLSTSWEKSTTFFAADTSQGSVAPHIRHQHPPLLLPRQVRSTTHEIRRHHHQLRLRECIRWPTRSPRLHILKGSHRCPDPRSLQPANQQRHPLQRRVPRSSLDAAHPLHHEILRARPIQRYTDGPARTAVRNRDLFRFPGQPGQQLHVGSELAPKRWGCRQRMITVA